MLYQSVSGQLPLRIELCLDYEGDLICSSKNSYIATLVNRHSSFVMLANVKNSKSSTVIAALIKQAHKLPS
jgi:IS30 family transposase|tara:strand:- start:648 stop:860 length:213 start_codon:yes stop_codon:yes gene_type:complete